VAYRMAPIAMTLSDLEGQLLCTKPFYLPYLGNIGQLAGVCLRTNRKAYTWPIILTVVLLKLKDFFTPHAIMQVGHCIVKVTVAGNGAR